MKAVTWRDQTQIQLLLVLLLIASAWLQFTGVAKTVVDTPIARDSKDYFSYAYNLRNHGSYSSDSAWIQGSTSPPRPDAYRTPGYPLFLLALQPEPTQAFVWRVQYAQAALAVLSVWLVFLIGRRFLPPGWALAGASLAAASPHLATLATNMLSETLFSFLLLCAVLASIGAIRNSSRLIWVLAGFAWGAASLVRPTVQLLVPLFLVLVWALPRLRHLRRASLLGVAGFAIVIAPWMLRNVSPEVQKPESSLMVKSLAHGSYPDFMYEGHPQSFGFPYRFDPNADRIARDLPSVVKHIAGRFQEQPMHYAKWYLLGKPLYFLAWGNVQGWDILVDPIIHSPWYEDGRFMLLRFFSQTLHWPLMLAGLAGAVLLAGRPELLRLASGASPAAWLVVLTVGYAIAFHIVVAPFPRYGVPFRPLLYLLAMMATRAALLALRAQLTARRL